MYTNEVEFILPLGLTDSEGNIQRKGKMRLATAYDEIVIQEHEKNAFNQRFRDLLVLCQVITELGDYTKISPELLQELYEVDFIYLQLLYKEMNSSSTRKAEARCPACGHVDQLDMASLFKEMYYYQTGEEGDG